MICPAGGIDKINAFVSLFAGNDLDVIAVTDFAKKDRNKLEDFRQRQVLKSGGLLTFADFVANDEADVEDLFGPDLFCQIVNGAYGLQGSDALDSGKLLSTNENTTRQVKKAEAYFNVLVDPIPTFDHFTPASWLIENPTALSGNDASTIETLDRAEELFKAVNALRGKSD